MHNIALYESFFLKHERVFVPFLVLKSTIKVKQLTKSKRNHGFK